MSDTLFNASVLILIMTKCHRISSSCFNGGTCTDKVNGYTCTCRPGFTGSHCQYEVNECDSQPCLNGGLCQDALESFRCSCPKGYTGNRCQVRHSSPLSFPVPFLKEPYFNHFRGQEGECTIFNLIIN